MAYISRETRFSHRRYGRTDRRTDRRTDGPTDRPSYRDAFLTDASKNISSISDIDCQCNVSASSGGLLLRVVDFSTTELNCKHDYVAVHTSRKMEKFCGEYPMGTFYRCVTMYRSAHPNVLLNFFDLTFSSFHADWFYLSSLISLIHPQNERK